MNAYCVGQKQQKWWTSPMNMIDITNLYEMRRLSTMRRLNRKIEGQDELIDYISLKYGLSQGIKKVFKLLQSVFSLSLFKN